MKKTAKNVKVTILLNYKIWKTMRKKNLFFLLSIIAGFILLCIPVAQAQTNDQPKNIELKNGEIINDNFFRTGDQIKIEGEVNGDAILIGNDITVSGHVAGDVIAAGLAININGQVDGNVRVVGQDVTISGQIGKNASLAGTTITLTNKAAVALTLSFMADSIDIENFTGGNVYGYANSAELNGPVGNNATFILWKQGQLTLGSKADIKGNLEYHGEKNAQINDNSVIKGVTTKKSPPASVVKYQKFLSYTWIYSKLLSLFGLLLIGTIIISLFSGFAKKITSTMLAKPAQTMSWGLLYLIGIPIASLVVLATIIGLPLSIITMILFFIIIYLTHIFVGTMLGQKILGLGKKDNPEENRATQLIWAMLSGTTLFFIITSLPYAGPIAGLIGIIWVLGALGENIKEIIISKRTKKV